MTTAMTTPPVQRARLTDAQLRPHRPTVEVLVPAGSGLLAKIGRGVKAILRMRQAESGRTIQVYRMNGQRDVSLSTMAAYQEVVDLLTRIVSAPQVLPEDWAYFIMCAKDVVFYDPMSVDVAMQIGIQEWAEHLRFFGEACRVARADQPTPAQ